MSTAAPQPVSLVLIAAVADNGVIGRDNGLPVSPGYYYYLRSPFPFAGTIERVRFELR